MTFMEFLEKEGLAQQPHHTIRVMALCWNARGRRCADIANEIYEYPGNAADIATEIINEQEPL